jgi:CRISPR-associated endonuclease/helicase Cas3
VSTGEKILAFSQQLGHRLPTPLVRFGKIIWNQISLPGKATVSRVGGNPPGTIDRQLRLLRQSIDDLTDVSIGKLDDNEAGLNADRIAELYPFKPLHVLMREEFEELFDTSPDLSGADIDISRFIRESEEDRDLQVF